MHLENKFSKPEIAEYLRVSEETIENWLQQKRFITIEQNGNLYIPYFENLEALINLRSEIRENKLTVPWIPKDLKQYNEWHEIIDELCWLMKVCYSTPENIKKKNFRLDQIFVNYLANNKIKTKKVQKAFVSSFSPDVLQVTNDLKRGWYNEYAYITPLKNATLGLSFKDIEVNKPISNTRFAFPSWRITTAYYAVYFYLRAVTIQKSGGFRIEEHSKTITTFKNSLLQPFEEVIWKFPLDISYTPGIVIDPSNLLVNQLKHTKFVSSQKVGARQ